MTTVENSHTAGILSRVVIISKAMVLNKNEISRDMLSRIYLSHWQGGSHYGELGLKGNLGVRVLRTQQRTQMKGKEITSRLGQHQAQCSH